MRRIMMILAGAAMALATPALAQNQFPDPNFLDPTGALVTSTPAGDVTYELPTLNFINGGSNDFYSTGGTVNADLLTAWPVGDTRQVSVRVVAYTSGSLSCRFRNGTFVDLNLAGTGGASTPVAITAGSGSGGLICRGVGSAKFVLQAWPAQGYPIFSITN